MNEPNTKAELVERLRYFVKTSGNECPDGYGRMGVGFVRGLLTLLDGLADWFEEQDWIIDDKYGRTIQKMDDYLVEAFEDFTTLSRWAVLRRAYEIERGTLTNLIDSTDGLNQLLDAMTIAGVIPLICGYEKRDSWLEHLLTSRFNYQNNAVNAEWHAFQRKCLRPMAKQLEDDTFRGRSGKFGGVKVMSYYMAGRVLFDFSRGDAKFSFVHDSSDMTGLRSGANNCTVDYLERIQMIRDVVANWNFDKFTEDKKVGIGF